MKITESGEQTLAIEQWTGTWAASAAAPTYFIPVEFMPQPVAVQGTIHYRLRVSAGGSRVRLRLSNDTGDQPLHIGAASIGLAADNYASNREGTVRQVTFGQGKSTRILSGAAVVSDPIDLQVAHLGDLIVSLYLPHSFVPAQGGDTHKAALSAGVDATMTVAWPDATSISARPIITALTVVPSRPTRAIVTLGDSITDGSTDGIGCMPFSFRGWPDILAQRLRARADANVNQVAYSVVNAGIGGNRLLNDFIGPHALARLDRDVFATPGTSHLIVFEGVNDIGIGGRTINDKVHPIVTADELIVAYLQIIERAHEQGIRVIGGTLPPFRDAFYFLEEKEPLRQTVNKWIREARAFDGLIDFDQVLHDPRDPSRLRTDFDTGDHLHPNAVAFRAMGEAINLGLFE